MKKLFASLLAATMVAGMAVSAFAVAAPYGKVGEPTKIENPELQGTIKLGAQQKTDVDGTIKYTFPILLNAAAEKVNDAWKLNDDSTDYYELAPTKFSEIEKLTVSVKAKRGGQYVGTPEIKKVKDQYAVVVELKDYYSDKETEVEFDVILKNKGRETDRATVTEMLQNGKNAVEQGAGKEDLTLKSGDLTGLVKFDKGVKNITLDYGKDNVMFEVKASEQGPVDVRLDTAVVKDIVIANPDADLYFYSFPACPEFDFTGTLTFYVADDSKEWFLYEVVDADAPALAAADVLAGATKKVVATNAKYNAEDACFELRTRKLGAYVLSDKELVVTAEKPADEAEKPADEAKPADKVVGTGAIA